MTESFIQAGAASTSFVGPDAVALFRAATLRSAIKLHQATGIKINRHVGIRAMLMHATALTGQPYGRRDHAKAIHDLTVWIEAMRSALPIVQG
jgi:hypothetical protein